VNEYRERRLFEYSDGVIRGANVMAVKGIWEKYGVHDVVEFTGVDQVIAMPDMAFKSVMPDMTKILYVTD